METKSQNLLADLQFLVRLIRTGAYSDASSKLNRCILMIQEQLPKLAQQNPKAMQSVLDAVHRMLKHLEKQDWVAFADVVEFELIPFWTSAASAS